MVNIEVNEKVINDIELMVFDKDGTIIDLYTYWSNMISLRAASICSHFGMDAIEHEEKLMFEMGVDLKNSRLRPEGPVGLLPRPVVQKAAEDYVKIFVQEGNIEETCFRIFKEIDETSLTLLDSFIKPLDGAIELLKQLKDKGCKLAIATTDKTERAELALKHLGITDLFDSVVGADKVEKSKPDPQMLKLIEDNVGVELNRSVMVGDAKTDVQIGINADCKASIAVCSGLTSKEILEQLTSYVVQDISKIIVL